jgi:hypothetical protein
MSSTLEVRELGADEMDLWDHFVASSPQGTIYSENLWLKLLGCPFRVLGCYKGGELVGGIAVCEDPARPRSTLHVPPFTPFQGILLRAPRAMRYTTRESMERKISFALIQSLHCLYDNLTLAHHYNYEDIRPFYWETYRQPQEYRAFVAYTYIVDLRDIDRAWSNLDDKTRCVVHKAEKCGSSVAESDDFAVFERLHQLTFERQGASHGIEGRLLPRVYDATRAAGRCQLFLAHNREGAPTSGVLAIWDANRAYYMFGASDPMYRSDGSASLTLWRVFQSMSKRFPEIDMVGCNSPKRGAFKAGFGGTLKHYFVVTLEKIPAR